MKQPFSAITDFLQMTKINNFLETAKYIVNIL